jgi:hypothetical protein
VFRALDPAPEDFMKEPVLGGPGYQQAVRAMVDLLEYRLMEDLARAWRVAQPNLEQCGLSDIRYEGLSELAAEDALWRDAPAIEGASATRRETVLGAVLDHLRSVLAIDLASDRRADALSRGARCPDDPGSLGFRRARGVADRFRCLAAGGHARSTGPSGDAAVERALGDRPLSPLAPHLGSRSRPRFPSGRGARGRDCRGVVRASRDHGFRTALPTTEFR